MALLTRRSTLASLIQSQEAHRPYYGADPEVHASMAAFWKAGLENGALIGSMTREGDRVLSSGMSMMARPEFLEAVLTSQTGGFGEHAVRWFLSGRTPWFIAEDASRRSAEVGLDVVVLHNAYLLGSGMAQNPPEIIEAQVAHYFQVHQGIRFLSYHQSAHSAEELTWYLNSGLRYRPRPGDFSPSVVTTVERPALFGIRRDELPLIWGTRAARMFSYQPPRLGLTATHRELLDQALEGLTDDEIAEKLSLSVSAIKKRWIALYDYLDEAAPDLLEASDRLLDSSGKRGSERRRHLLNYLRECPQEMNPQAG